MDNEFFELIETLDSWNELKRTLLEFDYHVQQTQYDVDQPEGFRVLFVSGDSQINMFTHDEAVFRAVIRFAGGH